MFDRHNIKYIYLNVIVALKQSFYLKILAPMMISAIIQQGGKAHINAIRHQHDVNLEEVFRHKLPNRIVIVATSTQDIRGL